MNAKLSTRMEIAFWDMAIFMLTESDWFRSSVRRVYRLLPSESVTRSIKLLIVTAAGGFASGIFFFLIASHIF